MKLLSVILNYKTAPMTEQALEALLRETESIDDSYIVVVDNDSQDGSFERLREYVRAHALSGRCEVVSTPRNGGFGYGNNFAMRRALASSDPPQYVYLLNSDAFPHDGAVTKLVAYLDEHPRVGIVGSYIHGPDGTPHETAFRFPSAWSELESSTRLGLLSRALEQRRVPMEIPARATAVDWLAGASMMLRRDVLEEVGLFDETFFLYFEETDLCRRASLAGWPTHYVRASEVAHIGSVSTGMKETKKRTPTYWFDSRRHYFRKNHGTAGLLAADLAFLVGFSSWRLRRRMQRKPDPDRPGVLVDFMRHAIRTSLPR